MGPADRKIHTTGRTSSRLSGDDIGALKSRLAPLQPTPALYKKKPLELEIGMGNGLALLERAKADPARAFLGSEVYLNGLKTLLHHLKTHPQPNVFATDADARDLLADIPPGSLDRILIPFPDPWPKARHHKRRIVQQDLLTLCAKALRTGGELWIVTDWPSYAYHSIAEIFRHPAFTLDQTGGAAADCKPSARLSDHLGPHHLSSPPAWWAETKYQQKARLAGRAPWFIRALNKAP